VNIGDKSDHDAVLELLPWFVNESLYGQERDRVSGHLNECEVCRDEKDQLQRLQDLVTSEEFDPPDYRFSFKKLMAKIDAVENDETEVGRAQLQQSSGATKWRVFATAASLVIGVFLAVVWQSPSTDAGRTDQFRTLTLRDRPIGVPHNVELTFTLPIKNAARRAALIETDSYIVSGPDESGRYVIEIIVPENLTDAEFVDYLQAIDGVEHAVYLQTDTYRSR